ncbi:carbohydrate ABC transporter permease [Paenibacillus mucilaginosus]|uniref:Sugar permease n=2 Tax=Paenibacillus mucilaginosus TaxID=61624 RepID=I0BFH9_9BACL|nr:carbohydrate ABC transporter permease [Paenibacillus mucilaginosus]AEI40257.1 sugar permease [Paenibacillus mucilaginosus KNP414]AFH61126.1 sugar permease [Paenibacillus mucilaginosus K02]MCG7213377.1 carbohydrate ABC transporter permease [Paenibacillus mucilaginosus]WDM29475.1 carbohydrate ABC transporter permease [Paenibacillus mucilaginosus]
MKTRNKLFDILLFAAALVLAVLFFFPIYFSLISAFKSNGDILRNAVSFPKSFYVDSFKYLWTKTDFPEAMVNSVILTLTSIVLMIAVIPMAAYAIERTNKKWTNAAYVYFLAGMMIPFQVYMIPLFKEMKMLGLYGSLSAPILIYISGSVGFGVLLYTSFIKGIPREIEEAASIDGCSSYSIFWRIVFPLLGPCTASMVVLNGLGIWNDFLMPMLVLPSGEPKTMIVEIFKFVGEMASQWDMVFAGTAISIVPVLIAFIALQKYFVKGVAAGATKG